MKKLIKPKKGGRGIWVILSLPLSLVFLSGNLWMQQPDAMKLTQQFTDTIKKNMAMMQQYSWKMRVQLTLKGEAKAPMLYQMRFGMDGKLQKTLLSPPPKQKKRRGLLKRIAQKKIAQAKELVAKLMGLHRRYTTPTPVTMLDFFGKAKYQVLNDGTVQFSAAGFMQANDRATFWFDQQSHQPRRFKFSSSLEGAAVEGLVEYTKVAFGPTYAGRTTLKVPGKKMSAKIENFDFIKQ
jgi:hypothetical protein